MPLECPRLNDICIQGIKLPSWRNRSTGGDMEGKNEKREPLGLPLFLFHFGKDEFTAHSFRSFASTVLNEHGWPPDVIERQLAHEEQNRVRAAYNRAEYLDQRREMMQWWADWCEQNGATVSFR